MPLILDNAMAMGGSGMHVDLDDVDELFGDGAPLSLPPRPPGKRLRQRLDDLRGSGCCQGIAWSKGGTIASITPDGQALQLRYLHADPKDGTWALSDPTQIAPWPNLVGGRVVHLTWSPANSELAVIDAVGRLIILNFHADLNRPILSRRWDNDPVDDLHSVVGTYWLNQVPANASRFHPVYAPAVKSGKGTEYLFEPSGVPNMGPSHPNPSKSALVCITTNGLLKMFWSQSNGQPQEATLELESVTSADDLVTHAAVCSDKTRSIFIALATASKQLRVVQVVINTPKPDSQQNVPPGGHVWQPSLAKRHIAVTSWFQTGTGESHLDTSMTMVSHIEMLPAELDFRTKTWSPTVILTVRSFIPEPNSPYTQEPQSIIDRWELLTEQKQTVHPAFEQLGTRRNNVQSTPQTAARLRKVDSTIVNKIVMGVHVLSFGKIICFTYNDGSVEYRDRANMAELYREVNLDRIHSIHEAGFTQTGEPSCLQMALSPSNFSLVQMCEDGQVKWRNLDYTLSDIATMSDAHLAAVDAAFVISTASAAANSANIDDILAVARMFREKDQFAVKWVTDMVRTLRVTVDYSEDVPYDHLIRNNFLWLCLSILNHLGWKGEFHPRHFRGKMSMLAVNLRSIVILISLASNAPNNFTRGHTTPLDEPEVVNTLAGCAKWSIDVLCWLCDSLFCLLDDPKFMGFLNQSNQSQQLNYMTAYLHSKNEVALHLLLCSATRGLLAAVCRRISLLDSFSSRALSWYGNRPGANDHNNSNPNAPPGARGAQHVALHAAYRKIQQYTSSALVKADEFDKLLTTLGSDIREAYSTSLLPLAEREAQNRNQQQNNQNPNAPKPDRVKEARQHCELNLLLVQSPPPSFLAVITKLFRKDLTEYRANTDLAKLFFFDFELLEIDDEPRALEKRRAKNVRLDLFKRVQITKGTGNPAEGGAPSTPWRRCARCAGVMEDLPPTNNKPGLNILLGQQKMCCCGGRLAWLP